MNRGWNTIGNTVQVWSRAEISHKMGRLLPGSSVFVVENYQGWSRFEGVLGPTEEWETDQRYHEFWVEDIGVVIVGVGPSDGGVVADQRAFEAFVTLIRYIKSL